MALPTPPPVTNPIPNNPFFAPLNPFVCGPYFPVAIGAGIDLTTGATVPQIVNQVQNVLAAGPGIALTTFLGVTTITSTGGGGGSGTVTSVTAGTGLTGGTITTSGTIALANTAVTAGAYTSANITVDAQGRITAAASGSGGGGIPCSTITGKGALVTGTAASTPTALAVGTDGYVLTACAACTEGLTWIASSGAAPATPIVEGIVFGCTDGATTFNTALGYNALLAPTATGIANVAIGTSAGNAVTDGYGNTLIGPGTGCSVTTGTVNTAVGIGALCGVTSGSVNLGVGICSGCAYTTETGNAVFGGYFGDPGDTNALILSDGAGNLKAKFDSLGALSFDGTAYGTAGQVLSSNGAGAKPTWGAVSVSPATPTVSGTVYGFTEGMNFNTGFGEGAFLNYETATGERNTFIGAYGGSAPLTTASRNSGVGQGIFGSLTSGCNNTAMGDPNTSGYLTTGCGNSAFGSNALLNNVDGSFNVGVGYHAGSCFTTGSCNVAIGPNSQFASNTGSCQLAIGFSATDNWLTGDSTKAIKPGAGIIDCAASSGTAGQVLMSNGSNAICWGAAGGASAATPTVAGIIKGCTTATNSALGCNALLVNTGASNSAFGNNALCANTSGIYNTAMGESALFFNTTGSYNTAVGPFALGRTSTGLNNTATGHYAMRCNQTGNDNTAAGYYSLRCNTNGCFNTAIGSLSLRRNTAGDSNTAIGNRALYLSTGGIGNTAIGSYALCNSTTGCANVMVGGTNSTGGYAPVFDPTTENDRVMIGSTATTNAYVQVAWTVTSDARDKTNVTALPVGLDFVNRLNPVSFQFKESRECDTATGPVRYGFLAQEVLESEGENPVIVDTEVPEHLKVTNDHFNAVLVKAIQELSAKVEALEAKLEANG